MISILWYLINSDRFQINKEGRSEIGFDLAWRTHRPKRTRPVAVAFLQNRTVTTQLPAFLFSPFYVEACVYEYWSRCKEHLVKVVGECSQENSR